MERAAVAVMKIVFSPLAEANGNVFRSQYTEVDTKLTLK